MLNGKVARDEQSLEMLDYIFANRVYDIGDIGMFGGLHEIIYMTMTYDTDITSYIDKRIDKANKAIQKMVEKLEALD
ncbi:MAG: hypothetical protein AB9835_01240 [Eubacteriales bacterium]